MMPKISALACALLLAFTHAPTFAQSTDAHAESAKELLTFLRAKERMTVMVKQIVAVQIERDPRLGQFQPQIQEFVMKHMAWDSLEPEIVGKYKEAFSEVELREILAFYKSETGRKALANMERILRLAASSRNEVMRSNAAELRELIEGTQRNQGGVPSSSHGHSGKKAHGTSAKGTPAIGTPAK